MQVTVSKKEASDLTYGLQGGRERAPRARHRLGRPAPCCVCVLAGESWCFGSTVTRSLCPKCGCRGQGRALRVAPNSSTVGLVPVALLTPGAAWVFPPRFVGTRHPWERGGNVVGTQGGSTDFSQVWIQPQQHPKACYLHEKWGRRTYADLGGQ